MPSRYKVPQDILKADKIFGPLTVKDFIVLSISGLASYLMIRFLDNQTWPIPVFLLMGYVIMNVFVKIHNMTFSQYLFAKLLYVVKTKKRVWIMHAAEIDYTKNYSIKEKRSEGVNAEKEIAKNKIKLASNIDVISRALDQISRGEDAVDVAVDNKK